MKDSNFCMQCMRTGKLARLYDSLYKMVLGSEGQQQEKQNDKREKKQNVDRVAVGDASA